jgi:zinc/manganese transport system permease protein
MAAPFVACLLLVAMFAYLGIHVIAREVIFVDLSLAQMASLGSTSALLFGVAPNSALGYAFALGATMLGAFVFALTRTSRERQRVPQEAIIGIVFVVASAASILVADRTPAGAHLIKEALVGSILWVSWSTIPRLLVVFLLVGLFHWWLRRRFFTISLDSDAAGRLGWHVRWWDFLFYGSFGVAITLAVPIAGVLLVFTFLVVPAVIAFLFTRRPAALLAISWFSAAVACAAGLLLSFELDLPTGPLIVCVFAAVLAVVGVVARWFPTPVAP